MHLKRYQRQTVQDALRAVREDLGPDALVLATRLVAAPGPRGWLGRRVVEVTAAEGRTPVPEVRQPAREMAPSPGDGTRRRAQEVVARLRAAGLDAGVAREVADAYPHETARGVSERTVRATLAAQLSALVARDDSYAPVEVFVGPPGVGKTTTIAKIAAQERARNGHRLGLVAADGFRVGAVEQLRLYADLLGAPLAVARTPYELMTAIETAAGPTLVDTAGRSPSDDTSRDMLRLLASRPHVRTHLVIAADTPPVTMRRLLERFDAARPTRLVLTKLDEADSLAPLVSLLRERDLPLSYLGTGQLVPDDLQIATPRALASWIAGDASAHGATA
jgi:flagellar biosynthesis protein FlhF